MHQIINQVQSRLLENRFTCKNSAVEFHCIRKSNLTSKTCTSPDAADGMEFMLLRSEERLRRGGSEIMAGSWCVATLTVI